MYVKYDNGFALFEAEETKKEESTEYLDYVTAGIKVSTSDSLELKLTNVSHETISYGEAFTMEVLHDGIWEKLPVLSEDYGFCDILYELEPGEYRFIDIDFAWLYGELHESWFRIIKEIYLQDGTVYSVPAEFGDLIENKPIVTGIVKEVHDDYIIMYSETAAGYPNETKWQIFLDVKNKDSYTDIVVGDEIVVYYDGMAAETSPLQVSTVYANTLKTPAKGTVDEEAGVDLISSL